MRHSHLLLSRAKPLSILSALEECQQMPIHPIRMRGGQAVRRSRNGLQLRVLDDLYGQPPRILKRNNLICVTLDNQHRHLDLLEVLGLVRLRERLDAVIRPDDRGLHSQAPESLTDALRDLRVWLVVAVERKAQVLIKLRTVSRNACADEIEHRKRKS